MNVLTYIVAFLLCFSIFIPIPVNDVIQYWLPIFLIIEYKMLRHLCSVMDNICSRKLKYIHFNLLLRLYHKNAPYYKYFISRKRKSKRIYYRNVFFTYDVIYFDHLKLFIQNILQKTLWDSLCQKTPIMDTICGTLFQFSIKIHLP